MLQQLREKFTGWIALAILALIGVTFVFVGVTPGFITSQFAAKVDGQEIGRAAFENAYQNELQRNPNLAGAADTLRVQVRRAVLENLVREQLILNYVSDQGYQISDQQVANFLQRIPDFQVDGQFNRETYDALLEANNINPADFEREQRQNLRTQQLQRAIGASAIVTPAEYRRYLNLIAEQRVVSLATITADAVNDEIEVTEDMVTSFYDNNPLLYQLPETADIEYVEILRADIAEGIEVTEEALQQYYEQENYRFEQPEQRQARHILITFGDDDDAAEAQASDLLARIQGGESFEALATEFSKDGATAPQGGDLGALTDDQLPGALGNAIFEMSEGELRGPVRSDFGFHVIRLDDIIQPGPQALNEVRAELLRELREVEADDAYRDQQTAASDALFDAADLQAVATATGLSIKTATGITSSGGGEPFGANQAAIDAIFDPDVRQGGQLSEVIELDANRAAVFRVTNFVEARRQPLEEVREQAEAAVRASEAEALMAERAAQVVAAVKAGEDFGQSAEGIGASVEEPKLISRQNQQGVDQAVFFEVFAAGKPSPDNLITNSVRNLSGGYTIYRLEAVLPGRPEAIPLAERDAGKEMLAQQSGVNDYLAFVQALYDEADIVINDDVLAAEDLFQ